MHKLKKVFLKLRYGLGLVLLVLFFTLPTIMLGQQSDTLETVVITRKKIVEADFGFHSLSFDSLETTDLKYVALSDILEKEAGLYIKTSGPNSLSTISVRGLPARHTQLYWNNIPIQSPTLGVNDLSLFPAFFTDNVRVNFGGAATKDGTGGLGGSIHLDNTSQFDQSPSVQVGAAYNPQLDARQQHLGFSLGTKKISSSTKILRDRATNDYKYLNTFLSDDQEERRTNIALERYGASQELGFKISDKSQINANFFYLYNDMQVPNAIGQGETKAWQVDKNFKSNVRWKKRGVSYFTEIGGAWMDDRSNYVNETSSIDQNFNVKTMSLYSILGKRFSKKVESNFKLNLDRYDVDSDGIDNIIIRDRLAAWAQLKWKPTNKINLNAALRKEYVDDIETRLLPSFQVNFFPEKRNRHSVNVSCNHNESIPTINDLYWLNGGNEDLKKEFSANWEMGYQYHTERTHFGLHFYQSNVKDWIQWTPDFGGFWSPKNVKEVNLNGVELSVSEMVFKKDNQSIRLNLNYNYAQVEVAETIDFDDRVEGKRPIYSPEHTGNAGVQYKIGNLRLKYSQRYTSRVYIDELNEWYMPWYAPADFSVNYEKGLRKKMKLTLGAQVANVFNEDYQVQANQPMPRRNINMTIGLRI